MLGSCNIRSIVKSLIVPGFLWLNGCLPAQVLQNSYSRPGVLLNGDWHYIMDPFAKQVDLLS